MIVKHQNTLSITKTAAVNAKQWLHDNSPALITKVDRFFETQAGTR